MTLIMQHELIGLACLSDHEKAHNLAKKLRDNYGFTWRVFLEFTDQGTGIYVESKTEDQIIDDFNWRRYSIQEIKEYVAGYLH